MWDASSSQLTLFIMLLATVIFLPIVLVYTAWVYPRDARPGDDDQPRPQPQRLLGGNAMWYFSWILGVSLACSFGILNAMWYEMREKPNE